MSEQTTLYDRLGGMPGLEAIVDQLYQKVLVDPELAPMFDGAPMEHIRRMQCEFIATAADGPTTYSGRLLRHVHEGKGITSRHFNLFARKLLQTLEETGLPQRDVSAVVNRIAVHADDVTGGAAFIG